jgi:ribosome-associated translation inhibitor RaiA
MKINIHTDKNIQGREDVAQRVESMVEDAVGHFSEVLTRVDVYLTDENAGKSGNEDKRCLIEANPKGLPALAVHHDANTVLEAIEGASDKLTSALEKLHGKRLDRQRHPRPV